MMTSLATTSGEQILYCALELSKNSWLLAVQFPARDNPSLHPITGGNTSGLMTKLDAARDRLTKISGQVPRIAASHDHVVDMVSDLDIYRSANVRIRQLGEEASIFATMEVDAMLEKGDLDGYAGRWRSCGG